ncbi:unnamed protein product, partial [marine sediment metagenome]
DDDILDDHVRTKEVFINNIDPNLWDDASFAKWAIRGESPYGSVDSKGASVIGKDNKPVWKTRQKNNEEVKNTIIKANKDIWKMLPSRWRVGVSLLAKEVKKMYDGELTIIGNARIKPYDILHVIDYTNDMHGAVEVRRVIHTLNPQTGFTTRITPDLIVNQKDRYSSEEVYYMSKLMSHSASRALVGLVPKGVLTGVVGFEATMYAQGLAATSAFKGFAAATTVATVGGLIIGAGLAVYLGHKTLKYHAQRIVATVGLTIGRDSLDLQPLFYRGLPYTAGIE